MLLSEINKGSEIGKNVKSLYANGISVPDELIIRLVEEEMAKYNEHRGYIFKGFPRTLIQTYILEGMLRRMNNYIYLVVI